jgi:hypothetical protein
MKNSQLLAVELIERKIYLLRGQKIMLDRDLAELYDVEIRVLNQAVRLYYCNSTADHCYH